DHGADTTIHLAELLGGAPYRVSHYTTVPDAHGRPVRIEYGENDHCCQRFELLDDWLRPAGLQAEGPVGNAHARLARSQDIVRDAPAHLAVAPLIFLPAPKAACGECDAARQSV